MTRLLRATRLVVGPLLAASCMFAVNATAQTLPVLSIDSPSVNEGDSGSTNLTFTVSLSAATSTAVTVSYADAGTGTATSGTDYTAVTAGQLTFAAGTTSQTIAVSVQGDTTSEPDETVTIALSNPTNATLSTATGTGTIEDNDTLSISSPSVDEGDSGSTNLVFTVSLSGTKTGQATVNYADAGTGTATSGTDYDAVTANTLTFAAGTTSQTITVTVQGDITVESEETVVIALSSPSGAGLSATASSGTGTIRNDDTFPVLSIDSPSVNEGDSGSTSMTFTVTLSAAYSHNVTVDYADAGTGTATSGTDYTALSAGRLTFAAGTTSQTFTVSVQGDTTSEPDETVVITLGNPTNATVSTAPRTGTGTGTIEDNDTLSISSPFVDEGDTGSANLVFTVSLGGAKAAAVTVSYADAGTGTATSGTDYTAVTAGMLTFAAGTTSQTITVLVTGDTTVEADETVVIALSGASGAGLSTTASSGTGTIRDDDRTGTPTFSITPATVTVAEGDSGSTNMNFTVELSPAASVSTRVIFGVTGGTATSGTDYTTPWQNNRITLRFNAGETSKTVSVAVRGDTLDEPDETVVAQLSGAFPFFSARVDSSANTGTGTITDDDPLPTVSIDSPTVAEGDTGSTNMIFTVSLSAASGRQVTVRYGLVAAQSTATSGTDFREIVASTSNPGTLTFAPGETSKTITVEVLGDTDPEADETVRFQLGSPTNAMLPVSNLWRADGTITDDDIALLRTGPASVAEGDSGSTDLTFTLSLVAAHGKTVTVDYTDTGRGTATRGTDYTGAATGTVTFAPGDTTGTITVSVTGDTVTERHQTVELALSNLTNARFVTASMASLTGTIRDDDGFPTANAGPDQTVNEGDTVTLSGSGSDPDSPITGYRWTQTAGPPVTLTGVTSATSTFTAPTGLVADEVLRFSLVVEANDEGGSDSVDILVNAATLNWSAEAGPNQTVEEEDTVSLSGRALSGGAELTLQGVRQPSFSWRHTGGGGTAIVSLTGADTATPSFTAPNLLANDDLTFTLTITVGNNTRTDTVVVTVEADNDDPTANAGSDQTVYEASAVTLAGIGSDPEGESLSYSWSQTGGIPLVTLAGATSATARFTAPLTTVDLTLTFELTVTAGGASHTDTVIVTVEPLVLMADAGDEQVVGEGDVVTLDGSRSTAPLGAGPLTYSWRQTGGSPAVTLTGAATARPSFTAPSGLTGDVTLTFELTVYAGESSVTETDTVDVIVEWFGPIFTPPLLTADAGPDQTVNEGAAVTLDGSGSTGPDDETLNYSWRQTGGSPTVALTGAGSDASFTAPDVAADLTLTFTLTVTADGESDTDTVNVTINALPTLSIDSPTTREGDSGTTDLTFTVTLSPASDMDVTVSYATADGTASAGSDYRAASGELRFAPGETELTISVPVLGDLRPEADETFTLTLGSPVNAKVAGSEATGTIVNDDTAQASVADARMEEGDDGAANLDFTVTLSVAGDLEVTMSYATADGTATAGTDYRAASGELRFAPGETELTISVPVLGDTRPEADETFTLTLGSPVNAEITRAQATGTIVNDDVAQASVADAKAEEGDDGAADLDFTVTLSPASDLEVTVSYATADGTATAETDYRAASGELRFAPGETELTVSVPVLGDTRPEHDETFTLTLGSPVNAEITRSEATGTIVNDDVALASVADAKAEEGDDGAADLDFTVTLSPASDLEVTVSYATADGTAVAGADYRAASGELRFAPGETELTVSVPVLGDTRPERDETFTLTLGSPVNAEITRAEATGTIVNDDLAQASIADARMQEGNSGAADLDFTVTLSAAGDLEVTMSYATADGTATAGTDYRAASGELRFAPGETELTVSVPVLGDTRPERDETFTLTLGSPVNAEITRAEATGTIVNDDVAQASVADARMEEGNSGAADLDFTVTLSAAGDLEVTLSYATADGTATAGTDYRAASGELRFAPGETELTVSVPVLGDTRPERDETFTLTLGSPVNAEITRAEATGTIVNDDVAQASVADARMQEGDGGAADLDFTVTLSAAGDLEVTVSYATADGTATAGTDYRAASGELRFAPGETELTVSVPVLGDTRPERDETFTLTLGSPVNAEITRAEATGTIVNDDVAQASVADARMQEGNSGAADLDFTVTLSAAGDLEVTVSYATADGTATAGADYRAASGELRFAPGETELTVSVPVLGDTTPEGDETFTLTLSSPSNAELGRTTAATGTIVDDDVANSRAQALKASLAGFGRALTLDAVDAISGRFRETPATRGSQLVLGGSAFGQQGALSADQFAPWDQHFGGTELARPMASRQLSLGDFLQRSSFNLTLAAPPTAGGEGGAGGAGEEAGRNLSLWGRASSGRFSGEPLAGLSSDGEVVTGYLGMDARFGERLLAGVALAHSKGDIRYGIADFAGDLDLSLTSVLPYVNFQSNEKLRFWSVVGVGWGEATFRDAVGQAETQGTLDLGLRMAALGANQALITWRNVDLELKSDAFVMLLAGEPKEGEAQPEIKARSQGIRLALAGRKELMASEQGRLEANLELGGRWDGGDAQTGAGTEVGGGLDYRHAGLGLGIAVQGQYLLSHKAQSFEEKGVSLTLEFDPGVRGQGFSMALKPAWGAYPGGVGELWNNEALLGIGGTGQDAGPGAASERLDLEWGYAFGLRRGTGQLRLQGALSHHGAGQRHYRFGGSLNRPGRTRGSLELTRQEWQGESSHGLLIMWEHKR